MDEFDYAITLEIVGLLLSFAGVYWHASDSGRRRRWFALIPICFGFALFLYSGQLILEPSR